MQKLRNIAKDQKWLTLGLGLIIGLFILVGSMDQSPEETTAKTDSTEQEQAVLSEMEVQAMPSTTQDSVERSSYLIEIIPEFFDETKFEEVSELYLPSAAKIFEVVFEHIVSPNSP